MIGELRWLLPQPGHQIHFKQPVRALYWQWREQRAEKCEQFVIENVRFPHDPLWKARLVSIQSACDGNHRVWAATHEVVRVLYGFRYAAGIGL